MATHEIRTAGDLLAIGFDNDPFLVESSSPCNGCGTNSWRTRMSPGE